MFKKLINMFSGNNNEKLISCINNNAFLVDVRTPAEFVENHIKGSINIPLNEVGNQLQKFRNHNSIVVFCRSGNRSAQAKTILEQHGFTNVINGGTWQNVKTLKNESEK